jgi:hypothetical protein
MKCIAHRLGLNWECRSPEECENGSSGSDDLLSAGNDSGSANVPASEDLSGDFDDETEHRTYKDDSSLRDQQSTGRKRAARWFPLDETALCEWAMKKNCGGGKRPIVGCANNLQQARHHGPDKNTLNNEKGNVHRICHSCHNRWHTLNDPDYVWGAVQNEHSPMECTVLDIVENEEFWKDRAVVTAKD